MSLLTRGPYQLRKWRIKNNNPNEAQHILLRVNLLLRV